MKEIAEGYYTVERNDDDLFTTVAHVYDGQDEVEIMGYIPGYTRDDVFGENSKFKVLAGPWELPR